MIEIEILESSKNYQPEKFVVPNNFFLFNSKSFSRALLEPELILTINSRNKLILESNDSSLKINGQRPIQNPAEIEPNQTITISTESIRVINYKYEERLDLSDHILQELQKLPETHPVQRIVRDLSQDSL